MTVNSIIGGLLIYTLLGLSAEAGAIYTPCTALGEFYHTNVRTPRWIGNIFQRPEMHRIHHEYEKHANNYGDIVWWDMISTLTIIRRHSRLPVVSTPPRRNNSSTCCASKTCTKRMKLLKTGQSAAD